MGGIRKRTRHCSRYGQKAKYIQVSYFRYTETRRQGRKRKYQESTPKQRALNEKRSKRYFEALVKTNFGADDLCVHPTYADENMPADEAEAKKQITNYMRRINHKRKKMGLPNAKYIIITETGAKNGRIHHHVIMDGALDRNEVEKLWGRGICNADRLQPDKKTGLAAILTYLMKDPRGRRRWDPSHNLQKPWESINDDPRMMSRKKMSVMKDVPEDSEYMKQIVETDNPGYELQEVEKEYRDDVGQWYFFCRMKLSTGNPQGNVDNRRRKNDIAYAENRRGNSTKIPPSL